MILGGCAWTGIYFAAQARNRVRELERFVRLFSSIRDEINYTLLPTDILLHRLCAQPDFADFTFLPLVCRLFDSGKPLQEAWRLAVLEYAKDSALHAQEVQQISAFGTAFGNTDKDGQCANCVYYIAQLQACAAQAEKKAKSVSGLYRALGVLTGLFLVILLV